MIKANQPTCFPDDVIVAVSSKGDNTMLDRGRSFHDVPAVYDRTQFCKQAGLQYEHCVFQLVQYNEEQTYDRMVEVDESDSTAYRPEVAGDGLFTTKRGVGLFLPVADCTATVVYDSARHYIALLHLGRHATYADLATCAGMYFTEKGSRPENIIVWMSPGASKDSYWLEWFDHEDDPTWQRFYVRKEDGYYLDLAGYNRQRLIEVGILPENIHISDVDTVTNTNYFSHLSGDVDGRQAVVAMMK